LRVFRFTIFMRSPSGCSLIPSARQPSASWYEHFTCQSD
jgi:hypothetical protein